ncbi:phytanoyl-CoA dioxygenase family protein [Parvularcula sp. ZS-1/3]|uniref:Phytanoyl-CoA dioxygenase family protein n=1 Tax=Parvularcula mediterranea TaxID=2732508 RepID=A0A7Y3RLK2_9PROT|nr:phytanoyl-CoA dioxygenase family protein [Parvularcula mediterranea]NNU16234.1 phytanoyl-CoA dioxygenase family protein [Parvularcula mediterranea]
MSDPEPPSDLADLDWVDEPVTLDRDACARFDRDGFVLLRDVLPAEKLARIGEEITALTLALNEEDRPLEERDTYDRAFLQVMNLWRHSERVKRFVFGRRLAGLAAELLGKDGVRLYHDQSLYKEPSGGITPAHADQYYWPLSSDRTVTAWIPLQPVPEEMGPLAFFAGSQHAELGRDLPISDESEATIRREMQAQGFPLVQSPFALGDVSFHAGWTFHLAGANQSDRPRSVMTMIYMDKDIRLAAPTNSFQENDRATWMPGARVGEVVDTPLNPILIDKG